jgi:hypothetical protein
MVVLLDPIETIGWLKTLRANGIARAHAYGLFLGSHYRSFPNIIWMHGNDFQTWKDARDDALVQAVAAGIRSADSRHIHTIELNYLTSGSLDDPSWAPLIELDAAYTYFPIYAQVLNEYNRPNALPTFMVEANYEFERLPEGSAANLRRQQYWTLLSGATGQLYGSAFTWSFSSGWQRHLDTPGIVQASYMKRLFCDRRWFDLIPDQGHKVVVGGYGEFSIGGSISADTYVAAARTYDGRLLIAYLPTIRTIIVDLAKLAGPSRARWYDPTDGTYHDARDVPLANIGRQKFTPPSKNRSGDGDWVLVLDVQSAPRR